MARGGGGNTSSRSILSRTATWTVQEQGSSSNLSGFLGFRTRSLRWCIHLDAVLSPRACCSRIVPSGDSFFRYYRDLCMHTYAIDEMTPHFFLLTVHRHPIGCLRQLVSAHILQGEKSYILPIKLVDKPPRSSTRRIIGFALE